MNSQQAALALMHILNIRFVTQGLEICHGGSRSSSLELYNDLPWVQGDLSLKVHSASISMGLSSQLELVEVYQLLKAVVLSVQAAVSSQKETLLASQGPEVQCLVAAWNEGHRS